MGFDLLLTGARVIEPANEFDAIADVGFGDGQVAAVGEPLDGGAAVEVRDVSGSIVCPGLIDLHTLSFRSIRRRGPNCDIVARRTQVPGAGGPQRAADCGSLHAASHHSYRW